jgi:hypothetical protein
MIRQHFYKSRGVLSSVATAVVAAILFLGSTGRLNSQLPTAPGPKSAQAALTELKLANAELLKKQQSTLERLEAVQKEASQLRIFASRH